jgi:hypothetical protein
MTRGVKTGAVTRATLIERLKLDPKDKSNLLDLLKQANAKGLITQDELSLSLPTTNTVVKCYLNSVVEDKKQREQINNYVLCASQLYVRGSYIANLVVEKKMGMIERSLQKYQPNFEITKPIFDLIQETNSHLKQCFLPERWTDEKKPNENIKKKKTKKEPEEPKLPRRLLLHPQIQEIMNEHQDVLSRLLVDWKDVMSASGWDNAINRMYTKYRANIENHVVVCLPKQLRTYLEEVDMDLDSPRLLVKDVFYKPVRPIICHNDDFEHVMNLRHLLGQKDVSHYMFKTFFYNEKTFDLSMHMKKSGISEGNYLPVANFGRKYCFIDKKIGTFLFKDRTSEDLPSMLKLSPDSFKRRRKELRKRLRKIKQGSKRKRLREKWKRIGASCLPKWVQMSSIVSVETDGVGLSIGIQKPVSMNDGPKKGRIQDALITREDNPVFVGGDEGRAKPVVCALSSNPLKKPTSLVFTRKQYYYEIKHTHRMRYEKERNAIPEVQAALQALSSTPKATNLIGYIHNIASHVNTMKQEYLHNVERPLWQMRLFRLKKQSLDRAVQRVFTAAKKRPLIIGLGDASFPSTGKGEKAVPTTELGRCFERARRRYSNKCTIWKVCEFRTTMCCCACGEVTIPALTTKGGRSGRLRHCNACSQEGVRSSRDRDVQAARNMLWITIHKFFEAPRPCYMCRP